MVGMLRWARVVTKSLTLSSSISKKPARMVIRTVSTAMLKQIFVDSFMAVPH